MTLQASSAALRTIRVGIDELGNSYPARRNCSFPIPGVVNQRVIRLPGDAVPVLSDWLFEGAFFPVRTSGVELIHLWNRISVGRRPWGVSYESRLPRISRDEQRQWTRRRLEGFLRREPCKFIAPISEYARRRLFERLGDQDDLAAKVTVVPPAQAALAESAVAAPAPSAPLRLVLVGHDLLRKGVEAILDVVDRCGEDLDIRLDVVGSLSRIDYACPQWEEDRLAAVRRRLETSPRVTWTRQLPNSAVIELVRQCHVGLLPTLADTYGYSLLEFMACGLPVIGTSVQAGPEILAGGVGWLMSVPTNARGEWTGLDVPASGRHGIYEDTRRELSDQVEETLRAIREDPEDLARRGAAALDKVRREYGSGRAETMRNVYLRSLGGV